jgi:hypothetical protein
MGHGPIETNGVLVRFSAENPNSRGHFGHVAAVAASLSPLPPHPGEALIHRLGQRLQNLRVAGELASKPISFPVSRSASVLELTAQGYGLTRLIVAVVGVGFVLFRNTVARTIRWGRRWCRWRCQSASPQAFSSVGKAKCGLTPMKLVRSPWRTPVRLIR